MPKAMKLDVTHQAKPVETEGRRARDDRAAARQGGTGSRNRPTNLVAMLNFLACVSVNDVRAEIAAATASVG